MNKELQEKVNKYKNLYDLDVQNIDLRTEQIESLKKEKEIIERAQRICQAVAEQTQKQLSIQLDSLVDLALETLFPKQYTFHLDFSTLRGKTEVRFVLTDLNTGKEIDDILGSCGGGLADIVCWALRVCLWSLGSTDNVIILDEPFRFLSRDLRLKAGLLLKELSAKLGLQFIMITHISEFIEVADKVFEVRQEGGVSSL